MNIYELETAYHTASSGCRHNLAVARSKKAKGETAAAISRLTLAAIDFGKAEMAAGLYAKLFGSDRLDDMALGLYVLLLNVESEVTQ